MGDNIIWWVIVYMVRKIYSNRIISPHFTLYQVVSFLGGQDQYEEVVNEEEGGRDTLETISENSSNDTTTTNKLRVKKRNFPRKSKNGALKGVEEESGDENFTMPFVDSYCQSAWRQHIVLEKLTA